MPYKDPDKARASSRIRSRRSYCKHREAILAKKKASNEIRTATSVQIRTAEEIITRRAEDKARRTEKRDFLNTYKMEAGCFICGYKGHPAALDFHHRDPTKKEHLVGRLGVGWKRLIKEVAKGDVVCANCHRVLSFGEGR